MMSQIMLHLSQLVDVLETWYFVSMNWVRTEFEKFIVFVFAWWRHNMTSSQDVTKHASLISTCRSERKMILFLVSMLCFGCRVQKCNHLCFCMMTWPHYIMWIRRNKSESSFLNSWNWWSKFWDFMTWRHDLTSSSSSCTYYSDNC